MKKFMYNFFGGLSKSNRLSLKVITVIFIWTTISWFIPPLLSKGFLLPFPYVEFVLKYGLKGSRDLLWIFYDISIWFVIFLTAVLGLNVFLSAKSRNWNIWFYVPYVLFSFIDTVLVISHLLLLGTQLRA